MGRRARDAYRRAPRDAPDPPWSVGTHLGEESAESGRRCSSKSKKQLIPSSVNFVVSCRPQARLLAQSGAGPLGRPAPMRGRGDASTKQTRSRKIQRRRAGKDPIPF